MKGNKFNLPYGLWKHLANKVYIEQALWLVSAGN